MKSTVYREGGFTLLEIVVAMAIVGLGVVTLLEIFSQGLRLGSKSSVNTEAMAYGRQVMDEVLARPALEQGPSQGSFRDRARWQLRIQNVRDADRTLSLGSAWELKEITVAVRLAEGGQELELRTYKLLRKED
jgi:general secretion pathway protein I